MRRVTFSLRDCRRDRLHEGSLVARRHQARPIQRVTVAQRRPDIKLDRISVYLPPAVGLKMLPQIAARGCNELWLNPGSESDDLVAAAEKAGLNVIQACSIVAIGESPHEYS